MATAMFSCADDAIGRKVEASPLAHTQLDHIDEVYEIQQLISWISRGEYKRIALQFPDELLIDAPAVASRIQECVEEATVFILGDTSFGSCCVDEVGAQHYKADCIIHFGRACLSPTVRLPVLYVFGKADINIDDCVSQVKEMCTDVDINAVMAYDTTYSYAVDAIYAKLQTVYRHLILSRLSIPSPTTKQSCEEKRADPDQDQIPSSRSTEKETSGSCISKCGRVIKLPIGDSMDQYSFIFVGNSDGATLNNLMMTFNKCPFYTYNPVCRLFRRETINVNKTLMKRYYLIERAKDASIVGIVAGTLGVAKYRDIIERLKSLLKTAGKKSYTFAVGKLNPAKLANFAEVDIYVLVACPESTLFDQSEFYRPVVSPLEMEIACNQAREWTGDYSTDFRELLPGAAMYVEAPAFYETDGADVSLISNKVRTLGVRESPEVHSIPGKDLVLRSEAMVVAAVAENAGEFLANRSWKGLEQKLGETPVSKATEGQHGIAASYQHEPGS